MSNGNGHRPNDLSHIRAVILDYGEVLCARPKRDELSRMARIFGIEPTRFFELYGTSRDPYGQGMITAEQYWKDFARRAVAVVDLVDGQRPQSRIARDLLGGERDLDPCLRREGPPRVLLDVALRVGLDLISGATLLAVAEVEHLTLVTDE